MEHSDSPGPVFRIGALFVCKLPLQAFQWSVTYLRIIGGTLQTISAGLYSEACLVSVDGSPFSANAVPGTMHMLAFCLANHHSSTLRPRFWPLRCRSNRPHSGCDHDGTRRDLVLYPASKAQCTMRTLEAVLFLGSSAVLKVQPTFAFCEPAESSICSDSRWHRFQPNAQGILTRRVELGDLSRRLTLESVGQQTLNARPV